MFDIVSSLLLKEIFDSHPGLMWMDSSTRLQTNQLRNVYNKIMETDGVALFHVTQSSIYAFTDPQMYSYLPSDTKRLKETVMFGANVVIMYRTEKFYNEVFRYWLYCAIDGDCMAPPNSTLFCPSLLSNVKNFHFPRCHRQDQSALNVLLANLYNFNHKAFAVESSTKYIKTKRNSLKMLGEPKICRRMSRK